MTDAEKKSWGLWVEYCRKLSDWYKCNPDKVAKYEPMLMTPPFDAIVESVLAAAAELTGLKERVRELEDELKKDRNDAIEALFNQSVKYESRLALLEKVVEEFDEAMRGDYHREGTKIRIVVTQESLNKYRAALAGEKEEG